MYNILEFANSLGHSYQFDSYKQLLSNWNGAKVYLVTSEATTGLCLGWPTIIREVDGKFEEITDAKEKLKIMNAADTA